ncbi:hypothetical protein CTI12_AA559940 [Artemisia annua]|uniref:RNA-directed DNA polymerase, eukaryota, Reverse transcriptase zinc-binding domain protein n=1 Tax=Artemisia annua TaxID=35608 RepID=A0A2U1KWF8_ARTAN|nr:hypothetical protein CTI12_AA559940 [Artemisia annua]
MVSRMVPFVDCIFLAFKEEEEEIENETESEEDTEWREDDGYEDDQWDDSEDWVGEDDDDREEGEDAAGDGNFRHRDVESEESHNGPLMGGVSPKVMGDGEGGAEYRKESREQTTAGDFIEGYTLNMEKDSNEEEGGPPKDDIVQSPTGLKGDNGPEQNGSVPKTNKLRDENGSPHEKEENEPIIENSFICIKAQDVNELSGGCLDMKKCVDQFQPLTDNEIKMVSEKNNDGNNCEHVGIESKAKSDGEKDRKSRSSNKNTDGNATITSHTRSKEGSFVCGNKLKGKLSMRKIRELARSKHVRVQRSTMVKKCNKDAKICQGGSSRTSRNSKAKSKPSSLRIGAEELSQIEEFGQHIGFNWGGSKVRDNVVEEVSKTGHITTGLGTDDKVDWIRELCHKEKLDVVGIQETKLRNLDNRLINKLWGSDDVDFVKLDAVGRSGGILTKWDTRVFNKVQVIYDHGFVAVMGKWVGVEKAVGLVNAYGPRNENERVALWDKISRVLDHSNTCWCGDFNEERTVN